MLFAACWCCGHWSLEHTVQTKKKTQYNSTLYWMFTVLSPDQYLSCETNQLHQTQIVPSCERSSNCRLARKQKSHVSQIKPDSLLSDSLETETEKRITCGGIQQSRYRATSGLLLYSATVGRNTVTL